MVEDRTEPFRQFLRDIRGESDRGLALVGAAFIDERLAATLQAFFVDSAPSNLLSGASAPLGTFSARIDLCYALGLIESIEKSDCVNIRKVRNEFAHGVLSASFQVQKIKDLCSNFRSTMPENSTNAPARVRFENAVITMATRLLYRDHFVSRDRRETKIWVDPETIEWRRTSEEMPPEGQSVVGAWWPAGIFGEWKR